MYTDEPPRPKLPFDLAAALTSAVVASAALVDHSRPLAPLVVAHSLCLQTGKPNAYLDGLYKRERRVFLGLLCMGGLLLACMVALAIYMRNIPWGAPGRMTLVVIAVTCVALAVACFVLAAMGSEGFYRRALQPQLDWMQGVPGLSRPQFVKISFPPALASKDRPITADVGYVVCAPHERRIIVEGVLLRHIIRSENVLDLVQVETADISEMVEDTACHLIRLAYRIDAQTHLILDLEQDSLRADSLRHYLGRQPLLADIRTALRPGQTTG